MKSTVLSARKDTETYQTQILPSSRLINKVSLQHKNTRRKSVSTRREGKGPQQMSDEQSSRGDKESSGRR